ncbi:MAG: PKD domain-containing protein, partial [Odoribacter sp.]|nr:PKD domain-containing protein [Odoribacter sp.]
LYREGDNYYFNPKFGAYEELDVPLVYQLRNFSCVDSKEVNMHVWPLPYVEAGGVREMCLNHEPRLLIGKDSVAGSVWQSNRGNWFLNGKVLPEHYFRAEQAGDFVIQYRYEDGHHCVNTDTTALRVHALPDTAFVSLPQYCRGIQADFTVEKGAEEWRYFWEYYAGASRDTLPGNGKFVYEQAGYYDVSLIAESVHGCLDTSSVHRIEVVADAPQADFTMSTHAQCGPEVELNIGVKEENFNDHNLHFEWVLGNGTVSDALVPTNPQLFYSTLEDTVYHLKFRVYNICNATEKADSLRIGSLPEVHFQFENGDRNCSPLNLQVLNTSTGSQNQYLWYMGDGSAPLNVFEPLDYVYETDSARKVFQISLVATNQCGKDSITQPLTVLAQSVRAFFSRPKEELCVGEQLCFKNHTRDTARDIVYKYWDFGDGVRDTSWNACHVYQDSGRYKVLLYVDNGCSADTTSKFVHVIGNPSLELLLEETNCDRDTFHFGFVTDQSLKWVKWTLGDDSIVQYPSFAYVYKKPGSYPVTLEVIGDNRAECRSGKAMVLTVHPRPVLHIAPLDTLVCPPYLYVPQVEGEVAKMMWSYGDGTAETSAGEHLYVNETDSLLRCKVVLHAVSDRGCPEDYTGYVNVGPLPLAVMEKRVTNGRPQKVDLLNLSPEGYVDYIWVLPGDKLEHTTGNQHVEFMENGMYAFSLITENQYGCRDTATVEHEVMLRGLYFPNTFIPHSLNGRINRFNGIGMGLARYKLEIFDRYGNKIWETTDLEDGIPSGGWDGCNRKGERLPQGVYIWRAEAIFGNDDVWTGKNNESGVPETTQGTVLLLRE